MRILVVAPEVGLNVVQDILAAARGNEMVLLHGTVPVREVVSTIRGGGYDVIHFATHGRPHALAMSDTEMESELLVDALERGGVGCVVFNACHSIDLAVAVYSAGVSKVIGWAGKTPDAMAIRFAQAFYQHLDLSGGDVNRSFESARETVEREFAGEQPPLLLNGRLSRLEAEVRALSAQRGPAPLPPAWVLALLFLGLVLDAALSMGDLRRQLGVPAEVAAASRAVILFCAVLFVLLWVRRAWAAR